MTMRQSFIEDDGESLQVALVQDGKQVGGCIIDIDPLGVDEAYRIAMLLGQAYIDQVGAHGTH